MRTNSCHCAYASGSEAQGIQAEDYIKLSGVMHVALDWLIYRSIRIHFYFSLIELLKLGVNWCL